MALSQEETIYNLALGYVGEFKVEEDVTDSEQYLICSRYYDLARDEVLAAHLWNEAMVDVIILQNATDPIFGYDRRYSKPSTAVRIASVDDELGSDRRLNLQGRRPWEVKAEFILANAGIVPPSWSTNIDFIDGQFVSVTPDAWVTATAYIDGQYIKSGTSIYEVLVSHTSDTIANDLTSNNIVLRATGSTVTYEVLVTHTSDTVVADITSGNISASGDVIDARVVYVTYVTKLTDTDKWSPKLKHTVAMKLAIKIYTKIKNDPKGRAELIEEFETLTMPKARSIDGMQGTPKPIFSSDWIASRAEGMWRL